jgi:hypothetical protein
MDKNEITRIAREAGFVGMDGDHGALRRFANLVAAAEREKVARWQIGSGYSTVHGDTIEDLLVELEWQVRESEREACAKFVEDGYVRQFEHPWREDLAAAIRARGNHANG